jgi:hypothetical protein
MVAVHEWRDRRWVWDVMQRVYGIADLTVSDWTYQGRSKHGSEVTKLTPATRAG